MNPYRKELKAAIRWRLAEVCLGKDDVEATQWYEKTLEILPSNSNLTKAASEAAYYAASGFYKSNEFLKAIEYWIKALSLSPSNPSIHSRIGRAYTSLDQIDEAVNHFEKALSMDPDSVEALRGLSTSYRYIDIEKAIEYAKRAKEADETDRESLDYLGLLYRDCLLIDEAISVHKKARQISPSPITDFYLSLLYKYKQDSEQALSYILSSISLLEDKNYELKIRKIWSILIRWAWLFLSEKYDEAFELAKSLIPYNNTARTSQALLSHVIFFIKACQKESSIDVYTKILQFPRL